MLTEQTYKLDTFLSSIEDQSIFDFFGVKIKNEYPKLLKIVKQYRKRVEDTAKYPRYDELTTPKNNAELVDLISNYWDEQYYLHQIDMPMGDDFYSIIWSIPKVQKVIEAYKPEQINFYVNVVADGLAPGSVDMEDIDTARNNDEPIITIQYPLLNSRTQMIVIDGSHRLAAKIQDKKEFIRGFLLNREHQYKALAGELDRTIYTVHNNLGLIIEYMTGNISKSKLKQWLLPL